MPVQLLETDLRGLWPQLQDTFEAKFDSGGKNRMSTTMPDFARQRRDLLQSIQLTLVERIAGKGVEEQLARMFRETAAWLRLPAGVAAAGGIVTVIVAMSSAAVADVTGVLAASAAIIGTIVAFTQRKKILAAYEQGNGNETPGTDTRNRGADEPRHRLFSIKRSRWRSHRWPPFARPSASAANRS